MKPTDPHASFDARRRTLLGVGAGALAIAVVAALKGRVLASDAERATDTTFAVTHTDAEWRALLTPEQYAILRHEGTERPYSSPLEREHRNGTFACAGCAQPLFSSTTKFESGTGWPSFWKPLKGAVAESSDRSLGMLRTEVRCSRCGGHLGHVFDDGPRPTGLRYCMNGVAMSFAPAA